MGKRAQELTSPTKRWWRQALGIVSAPFHRLTSDQRFWIGFGVLCVITTLLINNPFWRTAGEYVYKEGDIARESIMSPADIHFTDAEATDRIRETARETVTPTFAFEAKRADEAVQSFRSAWEGMQRRRESSSAAANKNSNARGEPDWPGLGGKELGRILGARAFSQNELEAVTRMLRENSSGDIYADQDRQFLANEILIVDRQKPTESRRAQNPEMTMTALSEARGNLHRQVAEIRSLSVKEAEAFNAALSPLVQPSVIYDAAATENARRMIAESVEPVTISLKRGERIVEEGQKITPQMVLQIAAIRNYSTSTRQWNRFAGLLLLVAGLFWAAWKFIEHRGIVPRLALSEQKTFALFGFIVAVQTVLMAAMFRLADFTASQNIKAPMNDPSLWAFAIPFAFGSLLMNMLADRRTALFTGIFSSLLAGLLAPRGLEFAIYATIASSVSVYGMGHYRSRQTITLAGLLVGVVSAVLAIAIIGYTQQPFILNTVALAIACGLASGLITAAVTAVFLPICESLFGILTDVKLLELSNADLPVLGQLALRAPGTNQHSHAVGQLSEEACRAVGANSLLTRIGALYHDIGKTAAPEHFVENQMGKNPHDKLKPVQSAKIIISHVTYGQKLAREMGLPQRIIDFIPQHHGTRTLHFFLKKAQAELKPGEELVENDFRYPGPKPQFKEAAIMMIADSCEAAARSLSEPTPENIRFIVTKIVDAIVADDQLDECDLTLRELTQIREAMIRSLVAIYHSRVDYPGYVPPSSGQYKLVPDRGDEEYGGTKYNDPADIPVSPGGEVEDEAVKRAGDQGRAAGN
ncbi:MAG: HD family phosphohydrolase [Pyrinomonadaceae bacterium]